MSKALVSDLPVPQGSRAHSAPKKAKDPKWPLSRPRGAWIQKQRACWHKRKRGAGGKSALPHRRATGESAPQGFCFFLSGGPEEQTEVSVVVVPPHSIHLCPARCTGLPHPVRSERLLRHTVFEIGE